MNKEELEASNRSKYGEKENDMISRMYRRSKLQGDTYCSGHVERYIDRFIRPESSKGNNMIDLIKAKDYLERMIEANETININNKEIIEQ